MSPEAVTTIVAAGAGAAVLAGYLLLIVRDMRRLGLTLGLVILNLHTMREQTRPVASVLRVVADDMAAIEADLEQVVEEVAEALGAGAPWQAPAGATSTQAAPPE